MTTHPDEFTEVLEEWLQEGGSQEDPYRIMDRALARVGATRQARFRWLPPAFALADGTLRFAFGAMAVAVLTVAGLALASSGQWAGGPPSSSPEATSTPAPSVAVSTDILGLPPEGAPASDPTIGELVLRFESTSSPSTTFWVYADGRMIWSPFLSTPAAVGDAYTGLVEQHLTAQGVDFLRSQVAASGLFADDLLLLHEGNAPYLGIELKTGDRWVRVAWAWSGIARDAPVATAEQEAALNALKALFADPSSWPASAWEDDAKTAYVPSSYAICIGIRARGAAGGVWLGPTDPELAWVLLPQPAQDLLQAGEPTTNQQWMHADAGCTLLTTDNARALALAFEAGGVKRSARPTEIRYYVAYTADDPSGAWEPIWIQFGPVLPDGVATWLGPG